MYIPIVHLGLDMPGDIIISSIYIKKNTCVYICIYTYIMLCATAIYIYIYILCSQIKSEEKNNDIYIYMLYIFIYNTTGEEYDLVYPMHMYIHV